MWTSIGIGTPGWVNSLDTVLVPRSSPAINRMMGEPGAGVAGGVSVTGDGDDRPCRPPVDPRVWWPGPHVEAGK